MTVGLHVDNSIAVIEDDALFGRQLCDILMLEGWTGRWFRRAEAFLEAQTRQQFDAALVDLRLPGMSGLDLLDLQHAKANHLPSPIFFMLTGDSRDATLAEAFAKGAHDFLLKPIRARELVVRLGAALRRHRPLVAREPGHGPDRSAQTMEADVLTVGPVRLEIPMQRAFLNNKEVPLTSKEWALAFFIFQHINQDLERTVLQEQVFRLNPRVQTRTVDTHISRLRTKLNLNPCSGFRFRSLYGSGYRLEYLAVQGVN